MNFGDVCWINGTQRTAEMQRKNAILLDDCTYLITAPAQLGLQNWLASPTFGFVGFHTNTSDPSNSFINVLATLIERWNTD